MELGYVIQLDPEKYHMNSWYQKDNGWYYNDDTGVPVVGWRQIDGKWYYLNSSGEMLRNTTTPDGYRVDANGAWQR